MVPHLGHSSKIVKDGSFSLRLSRNSCISSCSSGMNVPKPVSLTNSTQKSKLSMISFVLFLFIILVTN